MLDISLIISILILTILYLKLRRIQKRDQVLHALCDYRREIMSLMRSQRFTPENISTEDYENVRKALQVSNTMIKIYSESYPASFHIRNFVDFIRKFIKTAFKENSELEQTELPENEEIRYLQVKLGTVITWAVYHSTPRVFKISLFASFCIALLPYIGKIIRLKYFSKISTIKPSGYKWFREFLQWINSISKTPAKRNYSV